MVLHRNCNSIEGRILHWARRSGVDPVSFLANVLEYIQRDWEHNPFHPQHLSEQEHRIKELRKKLRSARSSRKKQQLRDAIKELQK